MNTEIGAGVLALPSDSMWKPESRVDVVVEENNEVGGFVAVGVKGIGQRTMRQWGKGNTLPNDTEDEITKNHVLASLLETQMKLIVGDRMKFVYPRWVNDPKAENGKVLIEDEEPMPSEIEDSLLESIENQYFIKAASNFVKHGNVITEFVQEKGKTSHLLAMDCRFFRKEVKSIRGYSENFLYRADGWTGKATESNKLEREIYALKSWAGTAHTNLNKNFLFWTGNPLYCPDSYYFDTKWRKGVLPWARFANNVVVYYDSLSENMYASGFAIRLRKGQFLDPAYKTTTDPELKQKMLENEISNRQAFLDEANKVLAGVKNAGRVLWFEEELTNLPKQFPDVSIEAIPNNIQDNALLNAHKTAIEQIIIGLGVAPTLANVETAGRLSSGSEQGNALRINRIVHTKVPRSILLEPYNLMFRLNQWNRTYRKYDVAPRLGFVDEEIVSLSVDPTGKQPSPKPHEKPQQN